MRFRISRPHAVTKHGHELFSYEARHLLSADLGGRVLYGFQ